MRVGILSLALAMSRRLAWAQTTTLPPVVPVPMPYDGSLASQIGVMTGLLLAGAVLAVVTAVVFAFRRRREAEALVIEGQIVDALLADPGLSRLPVSITVSVPLSRRGVVLAEVRGQVASQEWRQAVLRLVEGELLRLRPCSRAEDRLMVLPAARVYAA
jgi:hypothetical protein